MPDIGLGDVTIHYEADGPGEGTPIVLLHGLGSSSADWGSQVPVLAGRHRVLVPDLRGHGRSSRPRGRLTVANAFARPAAAGLGGGLRLLTRVGLLACAPMTVVAAHVARGLFPRADQRALYLAAVASLAGSPRRTYLASLRALARFDVRRRLGELRCPTLVIAGDRDRTVPLAAKRRLHRLIPGAALLVVDDSGHATPHDQAERFNAALLAFIESH